MCWGEGKCVGVWGKMKGSVLECGEGKRKMWGCGEVSGEVWESVLGAGGGEGRCGKVLEGMGKKVGVWGSVGARVR